ncbi:lysozyme [Paraburkholderia antibiotica]|uniref:Lysozyme n=1 Tax=Paraburkholderia antibiotica TaxID=2728839 RepID=A0A7X9ZW12_9BURK|nr:lysozyme [Paraburkholderia antibiotica]NML30216.1 lysozyme [Paraburkholderia antibiotica]
MPNAYGSTTINSASNSYIGAPGNRHDRPWRASGRIKTFIAVWESGRLEGTTRIFHPDQTHIDAPVSNGMILLVYRDDRGNPTVGCGHLVVPEDNLQVGQTIAVAHATALLENDLRRTENAINRNINIPLHQYEYDAMVSILFNAGSGNAAIEMTRRVNHADYENISTYITTFHCRNPRLHRRRLSEARVFAQGIYDASH